MTNNSDGLTPTLRPQLGIGWNRALPAPFGFDNCWKGDGVNDNFITATITKLLLTKGTIEFWSENNSNVIGIHFIDTMTSQIFGLSTFPNDGGRILFGNITLFLQNWYTAQSLSFNPTVAKSHWCLTYDLSLNTALLYKNGVVVNVSSFGNTGSPLNQINFNQLRIGIANNGCMGYKIDELRIYNVRLTAAQIQLNYNNGAGENPCVTEYLENWYKFEVFENLDFSIAQDTSDIRLGMRDYSGKNNHLQPINMDTNPASPNYVLKPF
jgi:hypothetical protein